MGALFAFAKPLPVVTLFDVKNGFSCGFTEAFGFAFVSSFINHQRWSNRRRNETEKQKWTSAKDLSAPRHKVSMLYSLLLRDKHLDLWFLSFLCLTVDMTVHEYAELKLLSESTRKQICQAE